MNKMAVIITTYHQRDFTVNAIRSYLKFCPDDLDLKLIVVENSNDTSYKDEVLSLGNNIIWVQNDTRMRGADANAEGVEVGMRYVGNEYAFLSHNDVCIYKNFFKAMREKVAEGNRLIGTCMDTAQERNQSIIILGCLVDPEIVRAVDLYPTPYIAGAPAGTCFECGDRVHLYCKEHNIKHYCFKSTHNNPEIIDSIPEPFNDMPFTLRTIDDTGEVIFMHFARGVTKTEGSYYLMSNKKGRWSIPQILEFCETKVYV